MQYKVTKSNVQAQIENITMQLRYAEEQLVALKKSEDEILVIEKEIEVKSLKMRKQALSSDISNLNYAIQWMRTGRQPGTTRGVENRAAYERDIEVDPQVLQQIIDDQSEIYVFEDTDETIERNKNKEELIKTILKILSKKEQAVFELASKQFTQREIGEMLGIKRVTVQKILQRCKEKIASEGWYMP